VIPTFTWANAVPANNAVAASAMRDARETFMPSPEMCRAGLRPLWICDLADRWVGDERV